jgi:DNA replication initiation complex subunit (GINS family)
MAEVKITYETLFDLLRREKSRNELQALDASFYQDVVAYLKEKKATLRTEDHTLLFSRSEQEKIKIQIHNIQKILRELYEIREKKVINLSVNKVRTESNLIDTSALLPEEISLFNDTCTLLSKYKSGVLSKILSFELPIIDHSFSSQSYTSQAYTSSLKTSIEPAENEESTSGSTSASPYSSSNREKETIFDSKPSHQNVSFEPKSKNNKVRILNDLPKFMGQDKNIYGPFNKGEEVYLPEDVTKILLKKGRIEVI